MHDLSDHEERVLGILTERSRLELEQIASAARLSPTATTSALDGLIERDLVTVMSGRYAPLYELNRLTAQRQTAAA